MHLPFLTLMGQFNGVSEGSRAAGKAHVMRDGYPARLSGGVWEQWRSLSCRGQEWVRACCRPLRAGAEPREGTEEGKQSFHSRIAGSYGGRNWGQCSESIVVKETALGLGVS